MLEASSISRDPPPQEGPWYQTAGLVWIWSTFVSYAAYNVVTLLGLLGASRPRNLRRVSLPGLPTGIGLGLLGWIGFSCLASPFTWSTPGKRELLQTTKPFLGLAIGWILGTTYPERVRGFFQKASTHAAAYVLLTLPFFNGYRLDPASMAIGTKSMGPNVFGACLSILIVLRVASRNPQEKLGVDLPLGSLILGLLLTGSRSATLLVLVPMALFALRWFTSRVEFPTKKVGLAVLALGAVAWFHPRLVRNPLEISIGLRYRRLVWTQALEGIQARPWLGVGARKYQVALSAKESWPEFLKRRGSKMPFFVDDFVHHGNPQGAHSDYFTLGYRHGIPATLLYLLFLGAWARFFWVSAKASQLRERTELWAGFTLVVGIAVYGLLNPLWSQKALGPFAFLFLGLLGGRFRRPSPQASLE